jgi:hypothetical protein
MDTFIVALIVLAAVIALLSSSVKAFRPGNKSPCGCGCSCSGRAVEKDCADSPGKTDRIA